MVALPGSSECRPIRVSKLAPAAICLSSARISRCTASAAAQARGLREREPTFAPAGGESLLHFHQRVLDTVHRLSAAHAGDCIVLVTHAAHMRRSAEAFEAAGFTVWPAPTAHLLNRDPDKNALPSLPGMRSAYAGWYASHEWLGLLAYRLNR